MDNSWVVMPSLAEPVASDGEALRLLTKPGWHSEQKVNGVRLMIHVHDGQIIGINRKGTVAAIPDRISNAFVWFEGEWVLDGEFVKGTYWVFDLPRAMGAVDLSTPYEVRRDILEALWPKLEMPDNVRLLPSARGDVERLELAQRMREANCEGVMLKDGAAPYQAGRRSRSTLKWKFWESCDVVVSELWREGKHSMAVEVYDAHGKPVDIGSVTMTAANLGAVNVGDVCEVKYLYVEDLGSPRLYQPAFLRKRDDKDPEECLLTQLKVTSRDVLS